METGLESNLILQLIRPVLRSQGVNDEDILSATQTTAADERDRARNFSKRSRKVNRAVENPPAFGSDCSDLGKCRCGPKLSMVISV